ncbi:ParM/StbA family protein [Clostridium botulinum]|nr:ParM/StbA family protein [Clostridium botulinum]NFJ88524.1 ParM/StbA family protein [Clostridium botulinum]HDI3121660.1 ParM/StbA family protein [Clostridium botulinum]
MEEVKTGVRITVVDLGNMNIKYMGENQGSFSSRISTDYQSYQEGLQRIELDGRITYIGIGELNREFNKCERDYIAQLLYAICKTNEGDIIETNLTLLLPSLQMENKKKLIENLKGKEFNFKFNGMDRMVKINEMLVFPEGFASFYSLSDELQEKDICILDLGSRTINICCMVEQEIQLLQTVKFGSFDFYNKIRVLEQSKGEDYKEEDIPRLIKNGTIKVTQKQYGEFLQEITNYTKPYVNLKTYYNVFTGGTSLMLKDYIEKLPYIDYRIHENALNSNAIGALEASKLAWEVA